MEKQKRKSGVYKISNPVNEIYIGATRDIERRFIEHKNRPSNYNLIKSIKEHGIENHSFEILEECEVSVLRERELFFIEKYKHTHKMLNIFKQENRDEKIKRLKEENPLHSFQNGYYNMQTGKVKELKVKIMEALKINSNPSWFKYLRGEYELKPSQTQAIEEIFKSYGVTEIWGK